MTFQELPRLRKTTEAISAYLSERLRKHLETIRPVIAPVRVLGNFATEGSGAAWIEKSLSEFAVRYREFGKPFRLPQEFDPEWVTGVDSRLSIHPWEYVYEARSGDTTKSVTMTSPLRWIVSYNSEASPTQMAQMAAGRVEYRADVARRFVVGALLMEAVLAKVPGVIELFHDLRFQVAKERVSGLHQLPVTTFTFGLSSIRPPDDLIIAATEFSGIPAFVELVDGETLAKFDDPMKAHIIALIG